MAVGDFFLYLNLNSASYTSVVPVGTTVYMQLSLGSGAVNGRSYSYNGVDQSTTCLFNEGGTANVSNTKILYDNTNYCRLYSGGTISVSFVEVK